MGQTGPKAKYDSCQKDFSDWHEIKTKINNRPKKDLYYYEKDIWWISVGKNIGFEEDSKGDVYLRPVAVLRKFNKFLFFGVPLSTTKSRGRYYYPFIYKSESESVALLSQLRAFDTNRLVHKDGVMSEKDYTGLQQVPVINRAGAIGSPYLPRRGQARDASSCDTDV